MTTDIATITDSNKDLIRRNYCPSATPDEFEMFRAICNRYGLDPFCREAWFVKYGGSQAQIFVGRDGMLAIANRSGQFDGIETAPNFDEKGNLVSATCTVWRKDMSHPFTKTVYLKEYTTGKSLWASKPITMLQKVAEAQALRAAFTISGLYCQEEMGVDDPVRIEQQSTDITVEPVKPSVAPAQTQMHVTAQKPDEIKTTAVYTAEQVNLSIIPNYQSHKLDMSVFEKARMPNGMYDKNMIDADYKSQMFAPTPEPQPEPEVQPLKDEEFAQSKADLEAIKSIGVKNTAERKRIIDQPFCVDCGNVRVFPEEEKASRDKYGVALCSSCMSKRIAADLKAKRENEETAELQRAGADALNDLVSASSKQTKPSADGSSDVCSICGKKLTKGEISKNRMFNPGKPFVCSKCEKSTTEN